MKGSILGPNPRDYLHMDYVLVECRCPKCKRTFVKRVRGQYIDKKFMKTQVCNSCRWKKIQGNISDILKKR